MQWVLEEGEGEVPTGVPPVGEPVNYLQGRKGARCAKAAPNCSSHCKKSLTKHCNIILLKSNYIKITD